MDCEPELFGFRFAIALKDRIIAKSPWDTWKERIKKPYSSQPFHYCTLHTHTLYPLHLHLPHTAYLLKEDSGRGNNAWSMRHLTLL